MVRTTATTTANSSQARPFAALALAVAAISLLAPADGVAQRRLERGLDLALGFGESDNIMRTEPSSGHGSFQALGMSVDLRTERPRFTGAFVGDAQFRQYDEPVVDGQDDDNETYGYLDGLAVFAAVPERFDWQFALASGQVRTDPFAASAVDNRERVSVVSTGPTLNVPLGDRTSLNLTGLLAERSFENSSYLDNDLTQAGIALDRALSTVSTLGLEISSAEVEFQLEEDSYTFDTAYIVYRKTFASGGVELRVGAGEVDMIDSADSESSGVGSINWYRGVGTRSSVGFWFSRDLTDPSGVFTTGGIPGLADLTGDPTGVEGSVDLGDLRLQEVILTLGPMERDGLGVTFGVDGEQTRFTLAGGAFEEDFLSSDDTDNDSQFIEVGVRRVLSQRWDGEIRARRLDQEFVTYDSESKETWATFTIGRRFADRGRVDLTAQHIDRGGDLDPSDETSYVVAFWYGVVR
jgi:hypothetical protein